MTPSEHQRDVETWRQQRLGRLRSDEGWLVLAGLFFLEEAPGKNTLGSAADSAIVLPAHSAPAHAGRIELADGVATLLPGEASMSVGGQPVPAEGRPLKSDQHGPADVVTLGDLRFFLIERDGRLALRLRDLKSARRAELKELAYFPIEAAYRVSAKLVPHAAPRSLQTTNSLGKASAMKSPGALVFELGGKRLSLDAVQERPSDTRLFILFRDLTAGRETYGAGRFLYSDGLPDKDGQVVLDFNKAYNPPCAFTPFATCPLPPPQNRLDVRVEAGEKNPPGEH
jgi:uncharacterized protein (DUF1684 family)